MPQIRDIALEQLTAGGDALAVSAARVDPAHSIGDALVRSPPLAEMPVAAAISDLMRVEGAVQLQSQADQLAAHLRQRQQELDRRESQLNSRLADFEKEVREARLWLAERDAELNERAARIEGPGDYEAHVAQVRVSTNGAPTPSVGDSLCSVPPAEWRASPQLLLGKSEELGRRQAALEIFREKVSQMHREALELRLAAEEARNELGAALGAELAEQAVTLTRQRLARYFHDEQAELTRKREELEYLKLDLAAEHDRLELRCQQLRDLTRTNGVDAASQDRLLTRP